MNTPSPPVVAASAPSAIRLLPPHLINKIAAGEVVERPASVVKELVENALDARATRIEVLASDGGRTLRIADNGCGMTARDACLAFLNHATSKLPEDEASLERLLTLGFRGEALASISAIARVTATTRTEPPDPDYPQGLQVSVSPMGEPAVTAAGCAPGTVLDVADLFYNTPARLKFLKRPQTELGHIEETLQALALSRPEVAFTLKVPDKGQDAILLKTSGSGHLEQAAQEVFKLAQEGAVVVPVRLEDTERGFALTGLTTAPSTQKGSRRWLLLFVNGRVVRCPVFHKAVDAAYESLLPAGRYPLCIVRLTLPHDQVDVNVHPSKKEVRYQRANEVFSFIRQGLRSALEAYGIHSYGMVPMPSGGGNIPLAEALTSGFSGESNEASASALGAAFDGRGFQPGSSRADYLLPYSQGGGSANAGFRPRVPDYNLTQGSLDLYAPLNDPEPGAVAFGTPHQTRYSVIGQLFNTYILLETPQGLMVVDQHIASERAFFESLSRTILEPVTDGLALRQAQLVGTPLYLSPVQQTLLNEHREALERFGFAWQTPPEDPQAVVLTQVPLIYQDRLQQMDPGELFGMLLQGLEDTGDARMESHGGIERMIATLACHSAVRAGDILSQRDMQAVIDRWLDCTLPWTCPHGRPIAHTIAREELQHFFHRGSLPVNAG